MKKIVSPRNASNDRNRGGLGGAAAGPAYPNVPATGVGEIAVDMRRNYTGSAPKSSAARASCVYPPPPMCHATRHHAPEASPTTPPPSEIPYEACGNLLIVSAR